MPLASPEDERAFRSHARATSRQLGLLAAGVSALAAVAWWPLDAVVMPDAAHAAAFSRLRTHALAVVAVTMAIMAVVPARARWVQGLGLGLYALLLFAFSEAIGTLGDGGRDVGQLPWLADVWLGVAALSFTLFDARVRLIGVSLAYVAVVGGFFVVHPGNLGVEGAWGQISFGVFVAGYAMVVGEGTYRIAKRAFLERRALDRANAALADLTASLHDQVEERTATLRALTDHLGHTQEAERRRLARDLHDDLGQQLTAMRYALARLRKRATDGGDAAEVVDELDALVAGTTEATRAVAHRLVPRVLDDLGLVASLEALGEATTARSGVACTVTVQDTQDGLSRVGAAAQLALYRGVQESITNALRHASPARLAVRVQVTPRRVGVEVEDDGKGFDPEAATSGFGLLGLRERLRALGGRAFVTSAPGRGTSVWLELPVEGAR